MHRDWSETAFNANVALPEAQERFQRAEAEAARLRVLVRRAAPFVNAVCVMADDRTASLRWLYDAGVEVGTLGEAGQGTA